LGVAGAILAWWLLLVAVIDAEHQWLPDGLTLPLLAGGLLVGAWRGAAALQAQLIGAVVGFAALAMVAAAYRRVRGREGLGGGDPRLFAAAGAWVGWTGLPSVLLWASAAGLSLVLARQALGGVVRSDDRLPFGTFLAVGAWLTWIYGPIGL
jgi:leader peptidase (prepilin peptidase)/N-methyltransferase